MIGRARQQGKILGLLQNSNYFPILYRVHILEVEKRVWHTQPSYDLPHATKGSMITLGTRVFFIRNSEEVLEYKEGQNPLWSTLPDTKVRSKFNVFYTMDYSELLI